MCRFPDSGAGRIGRRGLVVVAGTFLIDFDGVKDPKGFGKVGRIARNIVLAGFGQSGALGVLIPNVGITSPRAAKGGINDNLVPGKVLVNGARGPANKSSHRGSPFFGIGVLRLDVIRNLGARKEPDGNVVRSPLRGIDTATNGVEAIAVVLVVGRMLATACRRAGSTTVGRSKLGGGQSTMIGDFTARSGVKSDGVLCLGVDAFENVNLTVSWPLGPEHPVGWPCPTNAAGHVCNIGNEQAACEGLLRSDTDRLAALGRVLGLVVNAHEDATLVVAGEAFPRGGIVVHIFDEALGGILTCEEVEAVEEIGGIVCRFELISGLSNFGSHQEGATKGHPMVGEVHGE